MIIKRVLTYLFVLFTTFAINDREASNSQIHLQGHTSFQPSWMSVNRPDHNTGDYGPILYKSDVDSLKSATNYVCQGEGDKPNHLTSLPNDAIIINTGAARLILMLGGGC